MTGTSMFVQCWLRLLLMCLLGIFIQHPQLVIGKLLTQEQESGKPFSDLEKEVAKMFKDIANQEKAKNETRNPLQVQEPKYDDFHQRLHELLDPLLGQEFVVDGVVSDFEKTWESVFVAFSDETSLDNNDDQKPVPVFRFLSDPSLSVTTTSEQPHQMRIVDSLPLSIIGEVGRNIPLDSAQGFELGTRYRCPLKVVSWRLQHVNGASLQFSIRFDCEWSLVSADGRPVSLPLKAIPNQHVIDAKWSFDGKKLLTLTHQGNAHIWSFDPLPNLEYVKIDEGVGAICRGYEHLAINSGALQQAIWNPTQELLAGFDSDSLYVAHFRNTEPTGVRFQHETFNHEARRHSPAAVWNKIAGDENQKPRIDSASWSPDGKQIVTALQGNVTIWTNEPFAANGRKLVELNSEYVSFQMVNWNQSTNKILSVRDEQIYVWDSGMVNAKTKNEPTIFKNGSSDINYASWSSKGDLIVSVDENDLLVLCDVATNKKVYESQLEYFGSCSWSPDGKMLAVISGDGDRGMYTNVRIIHMDNTSARTTLNGEPSRDSQKKPRFRHISWSPDGKYVLTSNGSIPGICCLFDATREFKLVREWETNGPVYSTAWSPDSEKIVTIPVPRDLTSRTIVTDSNARNFSNNQVQTGENTARVWFVKELLK